MYAYPWYHWLTFFYIYCLIGWIFESSYVSLKEHRPVNRGFLHLPLLPLYGSGAIIMLWASIPFKEQPLMLYLAGVTATTILEFLTGYFMERIFKMKYWDYSDQKFNYRGYICLSSSLFWGVLTLLMTYVVHESIEYLVLKLSPITEGTFLIVITALFVRDAILSIQTAIDLGKILETITAVRADLEHAQVQLALLKAETNQKVDEFKQEAQDRISDLISEKEIQAANHIAALTEKYQRIYAHMSPRRAKLHRKLLLRNPSASSGRFSAALKELKERIRASH